MNPPDTTEVWRHFVLPNTDGNPFRMGSGSNGMPGRCLASTPPSGPEAGGPEMLQGGRERDDSSREQRPSERQPPQCPPLHGDTAAGRREEAELLCQAALVVRHHGSQLTRHGDAAGGRERLRDIVWSEPPESSLVDQGGFRREGQDQHHVRKVYRLPPRGWADLAEEHVDQVDTTVTHEKVGRLDVTVRHAGIPQ